MRALIVASVVVALCVPAFAADPPGKQDRYGDPLPQGAVMRLGTLRGAARITSFGVAADGSVITVGDADVRVWFPELDSPEAAVRLPVKALDIEWSPLTQVSPDAGRVAWRAKDAVVVLERRGDKPPAEVASFPIGVAQSMLFSPDGGTLAAVVGLDAPTVHLCDIKTGKSRVLKERLNYVSHVTFSGDGKRVAINTFRDLVLCDARSGEELARWAVNGFQLDHVALDHAGDVVAARVYRTDTREYLDVRFFEAKTGKPRAGLTGTTGGDWVAFAPDGKTVLIGDNRGVRWWDPAAGKLVRQFDGAAGFRNRGEPAARFTADGKTLVAATDQALLRWDAATGKPRFRDVHDGAHFGRVAALGVSADGKLYATGTDANLKVWDAKTGRPVATLASDWLHAQSLEFAPDGKTLYAPGKGHLTRWDVATGKEVRRYAVDPQEPRQTRTIGLRLSEDGKTLTGITLGNTLKPVFCTWHAESGERKLTKNLDPFEWTTPRYRVHFSRDASFASMCGDVFLTAEGPKKGRLPPRTLGPGFDVGAFSGDGRRIAFTFINENDPHVMRGVVYGTATGAKLCDFPAGSGGRVALNADGSILAAAGLADLTFWDANTGRLLARHESPPAERGGAVVSFAEVLRFTPDGTKLITGHSDTAALVWPVPVLPVR